MKDIKFEKRKCRSNSGSISMTVPTKIFKKFPLYFFADVEIKNIKEREKEKGGVRHEKK